MKLKCEYDTIPARYFLFPYPFTGPKMSKIDHLLEYIHWITKLNVSPELAKEVDKTRLDLLNSLDNKGIQFAFNGTKPHIGALSPGCLTCGQGTWSCLYITGACTANCFFCPQDPQGTIDRSPVAESIPFDDADAYVEYLDKFAFKGVGFSGGEPLLRLDRVLTFLTKIKQRFGDSMYIWLYTNGDLVNEEILRKLAAAGLNEIRFDIFVSDYDLKAVKMAREFIKTVTVEIPSLPEDHEKLKERLPEMEKIGVNHLNIHQLVATEHNYKNMLAHEYTIFPPLAFRHCPIRGSEEASLRLLEYAADQGLSLPINFCTHVYKARFQRLSRRNRAAPLVLKSAESVTNAGYIRRLSIQDTPEVIQKILSDCQKHAPDGNLWALSEDKTNLIFDPSLIEKLDLGRQQLTLQYYEADIVYRRANNAQKEVKLTAEKSVFIKRWMVSEQKGLNATDILKHSSWERLDTGFPNLSSC